MYTVYYLDVYRQICHQLSRIEMAGTFLMEPTSHIPHNCPLCISPTKQGKTRYLHPQNTSTCTLSYVSIPIYLSLIVMKDGSLYNHSSGWLPEY